MSKVRAPLCRFRRKNKNQINNNQNQNNDTVMESEDELNVPAENQNYENYTSNQSNNNHQPDEISIFESGMDGTMGDNNEVPNLENPFTNQENTSNHPGSQEDVEGVEIKKQNVNMETINNLIDKMNTREVDLDEIRNLSIAVSEQSELTTLQSFVSNKLSEMIKKTSIGEKCMDSLAPLCLGSNGNECSPIDKLLGCFAENESLVNENELQIPEAESFRDPPTLPSGIKFVDDFNKLLDKWAEESTNGPVNGPTRVNVFKLFNLSALLKHLGDPRYVEILNKLKFNNMDRSWEQILNSNTVSASEGALLVKNPLPELPNPKAISNCNTKLVDLPQLDNKNVDEHAFKLYWAYTNTWLNRMFGPSFKNSRFLQPTKNWYMNMERASQLFFLRLSKTLCSV